MDWIPLVVFHTLFHSSLADFFTVVAEKSIYHAEYGGDVVMGCRFQPIPDPASSLDLTVTWHWVSGTLTREVYRMEDGVENLASQDPKYQHRAKLLRAELNGGWAKLQLSNLNIEDSGSYQCLLRRGGADYKHLTLSVTAPYRTITKRTEKSADGDKRLLSCQSEGYPLSTVRWYDGHAQSMSANTTSVQTSDHLYRVTSQVGVNATDKNNYTCTFTKDGLSAIFHITADVDDVIAPGAQTGAILASLVISVLLVAALAAVVLLRHRGVKHRSTRSPKDVWAEKPLPTATCLQSAPKEEEVMIVNEGMFVETLGEVEGATLGEGTACEAPQQCGTACVSSGCGPRSWTDAAAGGTVRQWDSIHDSNPGPVMG